ncbi:MAG TPA: GNAT family N-acetyltransferase [Holophaga sp.]|nr:GNAT family N-acetyltransferase [Holophaga sp.]HPS67596.1 GNAT family N-acetyltransferase [Holophaga sp.]
MLHWTRDGFELTTDPARMDLDAVYGFISQSYWGRERPKEVQRRAMENSICFGVFKDGVQVAFARVVTDKAVFALLADVFVHPDWRGRGLSKWIMEAVDAHPDLQGLRRFMLATRDAHGLYAKYGFKPLADPGVYMERMRA